MDRIPKLDEFKDKLTYIREQQEQNNVSSHKFNVYLKDNNLTSGMIHIIDMYKRCIKRSGDDHPFYKYTTNYLVFDDIIWSHLIEDIIDKLELLDIKEIVIADKSTALMESLILFDSNGFKLNKIVTYGTDKDNGTLLQGILLRR